MNSITIHCDSLPDGRTQLFIDEIGQTVKQDRIAAAFHKTVLLIGCGIPEPDEYWYPEDDKCTYGAIGNDANALGLDSIPRTIFPHRADG